MSLVQTLQFVSITTGVKIGMNQGVYISISYLLPVEQLLQLAVQQLWSMMVQMYLDTLHPTLEVSHTSKGQLRHHQVASIIISLQ